MIFILVLFIAIAVYDAIAIAKGGASASISQMIIEWSYKFPIFTFVMGIICGHLFWRVGDNKYTKKIDVNKED